MNEIQAREILGCSPSASFKELKASYRRMIVLVHPDKAGQDSISQERAKEASSRLNHAWEYLENREKNGLLGKPDSETVSEANYSKGRATYPHECDICGFAPAAKISAPMVISFIYFLRRGKYELNACKFCGMTMSRMALRESLIKGWWGLGLFFIPNVVYRYFQNMKVLNRIDPPSYRDPSVITLSDYPFRVPGSPFRQPAPLVASAIAMTLLGAILFSDSSSQSSTSQPSMYFGEVNSCYEEVNSTDGQKIKMVDCTSSTASLKSVLVVDADYLCPTTTMYTTVANLPDGTTKTACLERI